MRLRVITLFPEYFKGPLTSGLLGRAQEKGLIEVRCVQLRDYSLDRHRQVDDYPYGGGAGMVLRPEPFFHAVEALRGELPDARAVLLSARGEPFTHRVAVELSLAPGLILICGHYKDVDERVRLALVDREVSLGDFVLSGGEPAALAVMDAVVRLLPGVLGDFESATGDSFFDGLLAPPTYTRPREFRGMAVPDVLLSGDHAAIERWRREEAERITRTVRPDLWEQYTQGEEETGRGRPGSG